MSEDKRHQSLTLTGKSQKNQSKVHWTAAVYGHGKVGCHTTLIPDQDVPAVNQPYSLRFWLPHHQCSSNVFYQSEYFKVTVEAFQPESKYGKYSNNWLWLLLYRICYYYLLLLYYLTELRQEIKELGTKSTTQDLPHRPFLKTSLIQGQ